MEVGDDVRCMCGQMIRWIQVCEHKRMKCLKKKLKEILFKKKHIMLHLVTLVPTNGWTNGWMDGWNGWMDGWVDGWMNGWMDRWTNGNSHHSTDLSSY